MRSNIILANRELRAVPGYKAQFRGYPIELVDIEVVFSPSELSDIRNLCNDGDAKDEDMIRAAFMLWFQENRMKPHWIRASGPGCC